MVIGPIHILMPATTIPKISVYNLSGYTKWSVSIKISGMAFLDCQVGYPVALKISIVKKS